MPGAKNNHTRPPGFILLAALVLLSATTLAVVMAFTLCADEARASRRHADQFHAELAAQAGMEEVKSLLLKLTKEDGYLVVATPNRVSRAIAIASGDRDPESGFWNLDNDPEKDRITNYLFISQWTGASTGDVLRHVPLFAGGLVQQSTIVGAPVWKRRNETTTPDSLSRTFSHADGVIQTLADTGQLAPDADIADIFKSSAHAAPGHAYTTWIEKDQPDGDGAGFRYTWWVEDLQGIPQPDVAGYVFRENPYQGNTGLSPLPHAAESELGPHGAFEDCMMLGFSNWDLRLGRRIPPRNHADPIPLRRGYRFSAQTQATTLRGEPVLRQPLFNFPSPGLDPKALRITGQFSPAASLGARALHHGREGAWLAPSDRGPLGADFAHHTTWSLGLHPYAERGIIPHGLGYPNAGQHPQNLTKLARQGVAELASYLQTNLPAGWEDRKGGFPGNYFSALAANMIDYMDTDHNPSSEGSLAGMESSIAYRGIETMPAVTELYLRLRWIGLEGPDGGPWNLVIGVTPFVEFWNPVLPLNPDIGPTPESACAPFSGTVQFVYAHDSIFVSNRYDLRAGDITPRKFDDAASLAPTNPLPKSGQLSLGRRLTLDPNQYKVVEFDEILHHFTIPATGVPGDIGPTSAKIAGNLTLSGEGAPDHDLESTYIILDADGAILDLAGGGIVREGGYTLLPGAKKYTGTQGCQTLYAGPAIDNLGTVIVNPGDPLISAFIRGARQKDVSYRHSTLGARNFRHDMADGQVHKETNLEVWPDGGYNTPTWDGRSYDNGPGEDMLFRRNRASLVKPVPGKRRAQTRGGAFLTGADWTGHSFSLVSRPADYDPFDPDPARSRPDTEAEMAYAVTMTRAPFRVSNAGRFFSLAELGHIHDPAMWQSGGEPHGSWTRRQFTRWRTIAEGALPSSAQGGGNTLRIGRPEHLRFSDANRFNPNTSGSTYQEYPAPREQEACRLLDILTTGTPGTPAALAPGDYHPDVHVLPRTPDSAGPAGPLFGKLFHAESGFRLINGQLNLNTIPAAHHAMHLTAKPLATDQGYGSTEFLERFPKVANLHHQDHDTLSRLYHDRPYYTASQLAEVFSAGDLTTGAAIHHPDFDHATRFLDEGSPTMRNGAPVSFPMQWRNGDAETGHYPAIRNQNLRWDATKEELVWGIPKEIPTEERGNPEHLPTGDAAAEESFARTFNLSNFSSRHFRIHVAGEYYRRRNAEGRPVPVASCQRVYEVFLRPVRNPAGNIQMVECRTLSLRSQ